METNNISSQLFTNDIQDLRQCSTTLFKIESIFLFINTE